jgi:hypothetical protein
VYHHRPACFKPSQPPATLTAELTGNDSALCGSIAVRSSSPVLALCRDLIAAGLGPDAALIVFRRGTVALRVRSIGEAAVLEINSKGAGFTRVRTVRAAPPMRPEPDSDQPEGGRP